MDSKKHSTSFKSGGYTSSTYGSSNTNLSSYASGDALRIMELQKKLETKEDEVAQLRKKKSANNGTDDAAYYQGKYEQLYSENQTLKNELFKVQDLLKNTRAQNAEHTPSSHQANSTSSSIDDNLHS